MVYPVDNTITFCTTGAWKFKNQMTIPWRSLSQFRSICCWVGTRSHKPCLTRVPQERETVPLPLKNCQNPHGFLTLSSLYCHHYKVTNKAPKEMWYIERTCATLFHKSWGCFPSGVVYLYNTASFSPIP